MVSGVADKVLRGLVQAAEKGEPLWRPIWVLVYTGALITGALVSVDEMKERLKEEKYPKSQDVEDDEPLEYLHLNDVGMWIENEWIYAPSATIEMDAVIAWGPGALSDQETERPFH